MDHQYLDREAFAGLWSWERDRRRRKLRRKAFLGRGENTFLTVAIAECYQFSPFCPARGPEDDFLIADATHRLFFMNAMKECCI